MNRELVVMELVVNSGNARSIAIEALRFARDKDFARAAEQVKEADRQLLAAHEVQTEMIQQELNGQKVEIDLLAVHAQDHMMNAATVLDLVKEMIEILRKDFSEDKPRDESGGIR